MKIIDFASKKKQLEEQEETPEQVLERVENSFKKEKFNFEEIMEENSNKKKKLNDHRKNANESVKRSYRLKKGK